MKRKIIGSIFMVVNCLLLLSPSIVKAEYGVDVPTTVAVKSGTGELEFQDATSEIKFGTTNLDKSQQTMNITATNDFMLAVLDARGTKAGWSISASSNVDDDKIWVGSGSAEGYNLKGAFLSFNTANSQFTHDGLSDFDAERKPKTPVKMSFPVGTDDNRMMYSEADSDAGMGQWTQNIKKTDITLSFPTNGVVAGDYTATIDWSLQDTPTSRGGA